MTFYCYYMSHMKEAASQIPELRKINQPPRPVITVTEEDFLPDESTSEVANDRSTEDLRKSGERLHAETREAPMLLVASATEASPDHPDRNEDALYNDAKRGVFGLADGMGGVPAGELASQAAMKQLDQSAITDALVNAEDPIELNKAALVSKVFSGAAETPQTQSDVEEATRIMTNRMHAAVESIQSLDEIKKDQALYDRIKESFKVNVGKEFDESNETMKRLMNRLLSSIATTATFAKVWKNEEGKHFVTVSNTGDSRMYRYREGKFERLTSDQTPFQALIDRGILKDETDLNSMIQLSDIEPLASEDERLRLLAERMKAGKKTEMRAKDLRSMMAHAIGLRKNNSDLFGIETRSDIKTHEVKPGDRIFQFSDGITDNQSDEEIAKELKTNGLNVPLLSIVDNARKEMTLGKTSERAKDDDATAQAFEIPA